MEECGFGKSRKLPFAFVVFPPEFFFVQSCLADNCIDSPNWNFSVTFLRDADNKLFFIGFLNKNGLTASMSLEFDSKAFQDLQEGSARERLRALLTHGS